MEKAISKTLTVGYYLIGVYFLLGFIGSIYTADLENQVVSATAIVVWVIIKRVEEDLIKNE